jgi:hypothetical protein
MKVVGCVLLVSLLASFIIMGAGETRPPLVGTAQCPYEYISTDGPNLYASADFSFYQNLTLGPVHALHLATPFVVPNDGVFEAQGVEFVSSASSLSNVEVVVQIYSSTPDSFPTADSFNSTQHFLKNLTQFDSMNIAGSEYFYFFRGSFEKPLNISSGMHFLMVAFSKPDVTYTLWAFWNGTLAWPDTCVGFCDINLTHSNSLFYPPFPTPYNASLSWVKFQRRLCTWLNGTLYINSNSSGGSGGGGGGGEQDPANYVVKYELGVSLDNFSAPSFIHDLSQALSIPSSLIHVYLLARVSASSDNTSVYFYISGSNSSLQFMQQALNITDSIASTLGLVSSPSQVLLETLETLCTSSAGHVASTLISLLWSALHLVTLPVSYSWTG